MTGIAVRIGDKLYPVLYPRIWQDCRTEEEYFATMRDRQMKGSGPTPVAQEEAQQQTPDTLF